MMTIVMICGGMCAAGTTNRLVSDGNQSAELATLIFQKYVDPLLLHKDSIVISIFDKTQLGQEKKPRN